MSNHDDARHALDTARILARRLIAALALAESAVNAAEVEREEQRLRGLTLAMAADMPDLVGDYVPAEWSGEPKEDSTDERD